MKLLLDNNLDLRFGKLLFGHEVLHCRQMGWSRLKNGELLEQAEQHGFDVVVTGDKQIMHQQNMTGRQISVIVLGSLFVDLDGISPLAPAVLSALDSLEKGSLIVIH